MSYLCRFTSGIISLPFHNNLTVDPASQPRPHCSFCANKRALWCCFALYTNIFHRSRRPVLFFGEARDLNTLWYNFAIFSRRNLCLFILQSTSSSFVPVSSCFVVLQQAALYYYYWSRQAPSTDGMHQWKWREWNEGWTVSLPSCHHLLWLFFGSLWPLIDI